MNNKRKRECFAKDGSAHKATAQTMMKVKKNDIYRGNENAANEPKYIYSEGMTRQT